MPERSEGQASPPEIAVIAGGAVALVGSFLPWYELGTEPFSFDWNAWSNAWSLFPLAPLMVLIGVLAAVDAALARFSDTALPARIAGIDRSQLLLCASALSALTLVAYAIRDLGGSDEGFDKGVGLWIAIIGMIAVLVGLVLSARGGEDAWESAPSGSADRQAPSTFVIIGAGAVVLLGSFLDFYEAQGEGGSAWSAGFFPLMTLVAVLAPLAALHVVITSFTTASLPRIARLSSDDLYLIFGAYAAIAMLGFLISEPFFTFAGQSIDVDKGAGFWLMFLGSIGVLVGAVMRKREHETPNITEG